jgi:hypothetical protein
LISPIFEKDLYMKAMNDYDLIIDYESAMNTVALDSNIYFVNENDR